MEVLKTIDPNQLKAYLQARGWYEERPFLDNATIWLKQDAERGEFEILLPIKTTLGDYVARIREAIATLEIAEKSFGLIILELGDRTMRCVICKHGETEPGLVTVTLERDESIVIIKRVPAEVCDNCGEYYLSDAITEQVLQRAEMAVSNGAEVEIIRYAA